MELADPWELDLTRLEGVRRRLHIPAFWRLVRRLMPGATAHTFRWADAVATLDDESIAALHVYRRAFVDALLAVITSWCTPFCSLVDAGTQSPRSDIDITTINVRSVRVLHTADAVVQHWFPGSSSLSQLFDTNLYCNTWYVRCPGRHHLELYEDCHGPLDADVLADQLAWSTLRIPDARIVAMRVPRHVRAARRRLQRLCHQRGLPDAVAELDAATRRLARYGSPDCSRRFYEATSLVAALQTDAYFSVGAYEHVVVHMQLQRRMRLSDAELAMSVFDNLGFLYAANKGAPHASLSHAILKYFYRCADALVMLGARPQPLCHEQLRMYYKAKLAGKNATMEALKAAVQGRYPSLSQITALVERCATTFAVPLMK